MKLTEGEVLTALFLLWTVAVKAQLQLNRSCEQIRVNPSYDGITVRDCPLCHPEPVKLGSNATLSCKLFNYCSITWYHRGTELHPGTRHRFTSNDQKMMIVNVTERDIGEYSCVASNGTDTLQLQGCLSIQGTDTRELEILDYQLHNSAFVQDNMILSCDAVNEDKMTWYHNGELVAAEDGRFAFQDNGRRLLIQSLRVDDSGRYTCVASNATHNVSREGYLSVVCRGTDVILRDCSPGFNVTAPLGSNLSVECVIDTGDSDREFVATFYKVVGTTNHSNITKWLSPEKLDFQGASVVLQRKRTEERSDENCRRTRILHTYRMVFSNVTEMVYGHYVISAAKGNNEYLDVLYIGPHPEEDVRSIVEFAVIASPTIALFFCFALLFVTWKKYHLDIKLLSKKISNSFVRSRKENDERLYDVYIACSEEDISLVVTVVIPALREKAYTTCCRHTEILPGECNSEAVYSFMQASRCCLLIISQGKFSEGDSVSLELRAATETFSDRKNGVIPVTIEGVSETDVAQSPVLKQYLIRNPKLKLRKEDMTLKAFRNSDVLKAMRLALPHPSVKNPQDTGYNRLKGSRRVVEESHTVAMTPVGCGRQKFEEND